MAETSIPAATRTTMPATRSLGVAYARAARVRRFAAVTSLLSQQLDGIQAAETTRRARDRQDHPTEDQRHENRQLVGRHGQRTRLNREQRGQDLDEHVGHNGSGDASDTDADP